MEKERERKKRSTIGHNAAMHWLKYSLSVPVAFSFLGQMDLKVKMQRFEFEWKFFSFLSGSQKYFQY